MKKLMAMILAAVLVLSMAACGAKDASADSRKKLTRGTVSGSVYTSEYSGLTFHAPDGWTYATDEQIAETMRIGMDILEDSNAFHEAAAKMATVYDAMVSGTDGTNINFLYENLAVNNALSYTEKDYLEAVRSQLSMFTELNYVISDEITTVQLCGKTYHVMSSTTGYNGVDMIQNYYVRRIGDYICAVIVTCVGQTTPANVEAYFG